MCVFLFCGEQVLQHSLEALIEAADGTEIVRDIRTVRRRSGLTNV
jgi:hypothetical protein